MPSNDWEYRRIGDVLSRVRRPVEVEKDVTYREIGIRSHGKGLFHKDEVTGKKLGNKSVFWIEPNCLVLNIVFAWEQAIAKTTDEEIGFIGSHRFPQFKPKNGLVDIDYLLCFFKTLRGKHQLGLASPGGAGRNKTLGQKDFSNTKLLLPPLPEQQKIARILSTWDSAIETVEKLIKNSQRQKKALMQRFMTGKRRLLGFKRQWKEVKLNQCAESMDNRRVPLNSEERSKMKGNIPYWGANNIVDYVNEYIFDETIILLAEDGGNFQEFQTRPIANLIRGKCWVNNHAHVLRAKKNVTNEWLYYSLVHKNIIGYVAGGTRAKLNKSDMLKIPILLPNIEEQREITKILSKSDSLIDSQKEDLILLKSQKNALMQQILTGKRRVKIKQ